MTLTYSCYFTRESGCEVIVMSTTLCVCVCVCLSVCPRGGYLISRTTCVIFTNFLHVAYGRGSVLCRRGDEIPRGRGTFGVFLPIDSALYGPYSGMNFVTKDRFGLNLLIYRKVCQNSISEY